jgi:hypothetical protein
VADGRERQVSERAGEASPHSDPDDEESATADDEHADADEQKRL